MPSGLPIDITNPDDIRAKFPKLEDMIRELRREADKLDALADDLAKIANFKRREPAKKPSGNARKKVPAVRPPSTRTLAVAMILKAGIPMSIDQVTERIEPPTKRETVGWAMWEAEKDGDLQRVSKGVYAPPEWKPIAPEDLLSTNGAGPAAEREDSAQR